jgi:hypothetical protein
MEDDEDEDDEAGPGSAPPFQLSPAASRQCCGGCGLSLKPVAATQLSTSEVLKFRWKGCWRATLREGRRAGGARAARHSGDHQHGRHHGRAHSITQPRSPRHPPRLTPWVLELYDAL